MAKIQLTATLKKNDGTNIVVLNSTVQNTRTACETEIANQIQARVDAAGTNLAQEQEAQTAFSS
jgi:hypothetical protein